MKATSKTKKSKSSNPKKKLTSENKKRLLTNAGKAIGNIMKMKKVSSPLLSKKTGIKIADINDFTTGKKIPTKKQVKLMYKALDVPKEVILLYSMEEQDVAPRKRELFNQLIPSMKGLIDSVIKDDPKKLSKKKVINKSVKILTSHKKFQKNQKGKKVKK